MAPRFEDDPNPKIPSQLVFQRSMVLSVEKKIRIWQSLLSTYVVVDVDFDSPVEEYRAEDESERSKIPVRSFQRNSGRRDAYVGDFSPFGRAALADKVDDRLIEKMSFFIHARIDLDLNRIIDSYDNFYLFLESNFLLNSKTRLAVEKLSSETKFITAVDEYLGDTTLHDERKDPAFPGVTKWDADKRALVREIVELRGHLRHNSLAHDGRWDINDQERYRHQAVFIGMVCHIVARELTHDVIWLDLYGERFKALSKKVGAVKSIVATITIKENSLTRDLSFRISVPSAELSAGLAKFILKTCVDKLEERAPAAELLAIRAYADDEQRRELMRYDLGPSVLR